MDDDVIVALPNPDDPEGELLVLGHFDSWDEALEWASDLFNVDEDGKIQVVFQTEQMEDYDGLFPEGFE